MSSLVWRNLSASLSSRFGVAPRFALVIALEPLLQSAITIGNGEATFKLRGDVTDPIADNVPRGRISAGRLVPRRRPDRDSLTRGPPPR